MRNLVFILVFFITGNCLAQIPALQSNTTMTDSINSIALKEYSNNFEFLISYSEEGTWKKNIDNYIIGLNNDECVLIKYSQANKATSKVHKQISIINREDFIEVVEKLTKLGFWTLDKDSLRENCKQNLDRTQDCLVISDGVTYKFNAITSTAFRKIVSSMPEAYIEFNPGLNQRKVFIACREIFRKYLKGI